MTKPIAPLTILFATETGSAFAMAEFAKGVASGCGVHTRVADAATYNLAQLPEERTMLIITSTHDGQPPPDGQEFFEFIDHVDLRLPSLHYAVLALGDSAYDDFCAAGIRIDERLAEMGATRLRERKEIDVYEEKSGRAWVADLCAQLAPG